MINSERLSALAGNCRWRTFVPAAKCVGGTAIYTCASLRTLRWAESRLSSAFARFCSWILVCLAAVICARTLSLPKAMRDFFRLIAFFCLASHPEQYLFAVQRALAFLSSRWISHPGPFAGLLLVPGQWPRDSP